MQCVTGRSRFIARGYALPRVFTVPYGTFAGTSAPGGGDQRQVWNWLFFVMDRGVEESGWEAGNSLRLVYDAGIQVYRAVPAGREISFGGER